jgi:two-component system, cell cycle sensor histidine kinase and response regulator CckA
MKSGGSHLPNEGPDVFEALTRMLAVGANRRELFRIALECLAEASSAERIALLLPDGDGRQFAVGGVWTRGLVRHPEIVFRADSSGGATQLRQLSPALFTMELVDGVPMPTGQGVSRPPYCLLQPVVSANGILFAQMVIDLDDRRELEAERRLHIRLLCGGLALAMANIRRLEQAVKESEQRYRASLERSTRLEEKMLEAQKMESLGMMAGGIAHDFNNLLATVLGNMELALEAPDLPEDVATCLEESKKATLKAAELSREMLLYAGQHPMQLRPLDLNESVRQIHHIVESNLCRNTQILYELEPDPPFVCADPAQIHQVLVNLISNADESLDGRPGTVTLSTGIARLEEPMLDDVLADASLAAGDYAFIRVADTGGGMDPKIMRQIFEPFFSSKFIGRGLGLAAVRGIIRAHRGAIHVTSRPGEGSVFTLYFPVHGPRTETAAVEPPARKQDAGGSNRILVVDDEEGVRQILQYVLGKAGYTVACAADGEEALQRVAEESGAFDAILLDLRMPRMSGEEVFRHIKETQPQTPVIVLTGYSEEIMSGLLKEDRPDGFIQKPFEVKALLEMLTRVL